MCILCPTYVAEIATPNNRGFLGSMVQIMVTIGVLQVTNIASSHLDNLDIFQVIAVGAYPSWRWLTIACLVTNNLKVKLI